MIVVEALDVVDCPAGEPALFVGGLSTLLGAGGAGGPFAMTSCGKVKNPKVVVRIPRMSKIEFEGFKHEPVS